MSKQTTLKIGDRDRMVWSEDQIVSLAKNVKHNRPGDHPMGGRMSTAKAKKAVEKMGVKIVGVHALTQDTANEMAIGLKAVKDAGFGLPKEVVLADEGTMRAHMMGGIGAKSYPQGYYHPRHKDRIYINANLKLDRTKGKKFVSSDTGSVIVHEMGHYHHHKQAPKIFDRNPKWPGREMLGEYGTAMNKVSKYAAKNPLEFVAETFTQKVYGVKASGRFGQDDVDQLYSKYGGPTK